MAYAYAEQTWSGRRMTGLFVAIAVNVGMLLAINNGLQFEVEKLFVPVTDVVDVPTPVDPPLKPEPVPVPDFIEPTPTVMDAPITPIDIAPSPIDTAQPSPYDGPSQPPTAQPLPAGTPVQIDARHPLTRPAYPTISRRLGEEGLVVLLIYVLPDGSVGDVSIKRSSGHPRLDQAAIATARKSWRFKPATQGGAPVAAWGQYVVAFQLQDQG